MLPAGIHELTRHLLRIVYLLLYVVIGVREIIGIVNSLWHGDSVDFNPFDQRFRNRPDYAGFNPRDDFQLLIASGIVALILTCRLWCAPSSTRHFRKRRPKLTQAVALCITKWLPL
jgi:hypothetical protein